MTDPNVYLKELERSMTALEEHTAETVGSLEKLRTSAHNLVGRLVVLDDLVSQVENMSKTQRDLVTAVGILGDSVREIHSHVIRDMSDVRKRLHTLESKAAE